MPTRIPKNLGGRNNLLKAQKDTMLSRLQRTQLNKLAQHITQSYNKRSYAQHVDLPQKTDPALMPPYEKLLRQLKVVKKVLNGRPLSLAEKIVYSHLHNVEESLGGGGDIRGKKYLKLKPDRVAMQDASAQMSLYALPLVSTTFHWF